MIPQAIESLSLNAIKVVGAQTTEHVGEMKSQGVVDQIDGRIGGQYPIRTAGQPSHLGFTGRSFSQWLLDSLSSVLTPCFIPRAIYTPVSPSCKICLIRYNILSIWNWVFEKSESCLFVKSFLSSLSIILLFKYYYFMFSLTYFVSLVIVKMSG